MGLSRDVSWPPTLFNIMFFALLFDAFSSSGIGIGTRYRTDHFVNLRKLQAKTKMKTIVNEFLIADDCAKINMQNSVDKFSVASDNFGLTVSTKKTEVIHQLAPWKPYVEFNITIMGQRLKVVKKSSPSSAAPSPSLFSWMTRGTPDLQKRLQPLADSTGMCGIGEASRRQPKLKYTELSFLPPSFMAEKRELLTNGI